MKIDKNMYPDAADRYLARFKKRGLKMKPKTKKSDIGQPTVLNVDGTYNIYITAHPGHLQKLTGRIHGHAYKSKPNHAARYQKIDDVFPPLASLFAPKEHDHGQADR